MNEANRRFLFVSVDTPPRRGGVSHLGASLSRELARSQDGTSIFVGPATTVLESDSNLNLIVDYQSRPTLRSGQYASHEDERIEDFIGDLLDAYEITNLILWHGFYYGSGAVAASARRGIDSSLFVHGTELTSQFPDLFHRHMLEARADDPDSLGDRFIRTIDNVDRVFANSQYTQCLTARTGTDTPIISVGCGIDRSIWDRETQRLPSYSLEAKAEARVDAGLPEKFTLCFVGRMVQHKNPVLLLELLREMPEIQLALIGSGPLDTQIARLIADWNLQHRVFHLAHATDEEKWGLLRAANLGLLPSGIDDVTGGYEGFGISMLEYTAAGCVAISSAQQGLSEFESHRKSANPVICVSRPMQENVATIQHFQANAKAAHDSVAMARAMVGERFVWDMVADRILQELT